MKRKPSPSLTILRTLAVLGVAASIGLAAAPPCDARPGGVIVDRSGNPPEYKSCMEAGTCHDTPPNIKTVVIGSLRVEGLPPQYDPTVTYTIKLIASASSDKVKSWGFQGTFVLADNKKAGMLTVTDADRTQIKTGMDREFMTQKITMGGTVGKDGTLPLAADPVSTCTWSFKWKPPAKGLVRFYAAAVLGDGAGRKNDLVYTLSTAMGVPEAAPQDPGKTGLPAESHLFLNRPNPFNPSTVIEYSVPSAGHAALLVYNAQGQRVRTLVDESLDAGKYSVQWDGRADNGEPVAAGTYLYRLQVGEQVEVRKMVLLK